MKNVAVFFGGQSVEHDISVLTGVMTLNSLDKSIFNGVPIYVSRSGEWFSGQELFDIDNYKKINLKRLKKVAILGGENWLYIMKGKKLKKLCPISVAVNCMHGERGEDGCLAGLLNMSKIPLASPDILASSICIDKAFTKTVLGGLKIKTVKGVAIESADEIALVKKSIKFPMLVKPNSLGSSIGVSRADDENQLYSAVNYALKFSDKVIIEPCFENFIEINCACYKNSGGKIIVSDCERPIGRTEILSFDDKYEKGKRVFPADIEKILSDKIKEITQKIYKKLNFRGVIRVDYFIKDKVIYVNEINTVPGSLAYYLFGDSISNLSKMLTQLISGALKDFNKRSLLQTDYNSGILKTSGAKGAKGAKTAHKNA